MNKAWRGCFNHLSRTRGRLSAVPNPAPPCRLSRLQQAFPPSSTYIPLGVVHREPARQGDAERGATDFGEAWPHHKTPARSRSFKLRVFEPQDPGPEWNASRTYWKGRPNGGQPTAPRPASSTAIISRSRRRAARAGARRGFDLGGPSLTPPERLRLRLTARRAAWVPERARRPHDVFSANPPMNTTRCRTADLNVRKGAGLCPSTTTALLPIHTAPRR